MLKSEKSRQALTFVIFGWGIALFFQALAASPERVDSGTGESTSLRDLYRGNASDEASVMVGSLSIMLIDGSGSKEVRVDHPFRAGNRFRFVVSSNNDGWLYILHRSPDGKAQQLWPQQSAQAGLSKHSQIKAGQSYLIPPSPGAFRFDEEVGQEEFIVAIRSQKKAPDLSLLTAAAPPPTPEVHTQSVAEPQNPGETNPRPRKKTTGNIAIRGDPFGGGATRGILFAPGTDDPDPRLYFSTALSGSATSAMVKFKLRHRE